MKPLTAESVPASLQMFIPEAEFWGLPEDGAIQELVDSATDDELRVLFDTVRAMPETLDSWLEASPEFGKASPEYIRFSCLIVAYEFAKLKVHATDA